MTAETLSLHPDIKNTRILQKIALRAGLTGYGNIDGQTTTAVVVDVETTGLDHENDVIIELAMRRFRFDDNGVIVEIGKAFTWREDPGCPLSQDIILLTGLTNADLVGQRLDEKTIFKIVEEADMVIAHNAAFDRPIIEKRLPLLPRKPWACSCEGIDWRDAGFEGRVLGYLAMQAGWYFSGHRAENDVDAVIELLRHEGAHGAPLMYELYEHALSDTHLVEACGAAFDVKDSLRLRGYRWNAPEKVWWREVSDSDLLEEQAWLAIHVYANAKGSRNHAPRITMRSAFSRYR